MKNHLLDAFFLLLSDVRHAASGIGRRARQRLAVMSWLQLLFACIGLVILVALLHVALFLFLLFMLVKLLIVSIVVGARRRRSKAEPPYTVEHKKPGSGY